MKISIIGAGAMGGAIARGLIDASPEFIESPQDICVSNPHKGKLVPLAELGCRTTASNREAVTGAELVAVCVKPRLLREVLEEIAPALKPGVHVCVVVAGISPEEISKWLTAEGKPVPDHSIAMPNTAMAIRESMTFIVPCKGPCDVSEMLFEQLGAVRVIPFRLLPAATALASCGIAYALRYVRAATEGGVQLGFKAAEAQEIVAQTLIGAAALLLQPGAHPEVEIDKVTTPGGWTIRGLNAMEREGFTRAVIEGHIACTR